MMVPPSMVGTVTVDPRAASARVIGTRTHRSAPCRSNGGWGATLTMAYRVAFGEAVWAPFGWADSGDAKARAVLHSGRDADRDLRRSAGRPGARASDALLGGCLALPVAGAAHLADGDPARVPHMDTNAGARGAGAFGPADA